MKHARRTAQTAASSKTPLPQAQQRQQQRRGRALPDGLQHQQRTTPCPGRGAAEAQAALPSPTAPWHSSGSLPAPARPPARSPAAPRSSGSGRRHPRLRKEHAGGRKTASGAMPQEDCTSASGLNSSEPLCPCVWPGVEGLPLTVLPLELREAGPDLLGASLVGCTMTGLDCGTAARRALQILQGRRAGARGRPRQGAEVAPGARWLARQQHCGRAPPWRWPPPSPCRTRTWG